MLPILEKKPLTVLLLACLFFLWGGITVLQEVFPYQLLKPLLSSTGGFSSAGDLTTPVIKKETKNQVELNKQWAKNVISGGYILHFRHAQREKWNDVQAFDAYELKKGIDAEHTSFSRAVCLTSQGVEEAKLIGHVFALEKVNISYIVSSPSCRARQTAMHAFGRIDGINNALLHRTAMVEDQHPVFAKELRRLMETVEIKPGQNVFLSGHAGTLRYDGVTVIDINHTGDIDARDETGFVVIERKDGVLVAQHLFKSIKEFTTAVVELPIR